MLRLDERAFSHGRLQSARLAVAARGQTEEAGQLVHRGRHHVRCVHADPLFGLQAGQCR